MPLGVTRPARRFHAVVIAVDGDRMRRMAIVDKKSPSGPNQK
jgi:hypothetical protein